MSKGKELKKTLGKKQRTVTTHVDSAMAIGARGLPVRRLFDVSIGGLAFEFCALIAAIEAPHAL